MRRRITAVDSMTWTNDFDVNVCSDSTVRYSGGVSSRARVGARDTP